MINDFLKLLEVWRWDKLAVHSRHVYKIPEGQCLFARKGKVVNDKMWLQTVQGKDGDGGLTALTNRCPSEDGEPEQIMETSCLPMIRLCSLRRRMWSLSGMCQEA